MRYWPAIDGLRAVAVLLVLMFHAKVPLFAGGFIGVDVFFVISGFLITTLIREEHAAGRFTLAGFYERRVRRILPAFLLVAAATLAMGTLILFPADLARLGSSAVAATLFVSNFYFWVIQGKNYFLDESGFLPLLHTWSLAIEEQFYILFPILMLWLLRFPMRRVEIVLPCLALLSFAASCYLTFAHPAAAFYFSPGRAWELLLGASIAVTRPPPFALRRHGPALQAVGLLMILWAALSFDARTPFPGPAALVPCVGAALLIACRDRGSGLMRGLSHPAVVWLGLISYPLYLWHWPLLVLGRLALARELYGYEIVALYSLAGILAAATWRYVERPFRARPSVMSAKRVAAVAAGGACLVLAAGSALRATDGLRAMQSAEVTRILVAANELDGSRDACHNWDRVNQERFSACVIGDKARPAFDFALWGDSHAGAIASAVDSVAKAAGKKGLQLTADNCPPLLGTRIILGREEKADCETRNDEAFRLLRRHRVRHVVLTGQWAWYAEGLGFLRPIHPVALMPSDARATSASPAGAVQRALTGTIDRLRAAGVDVMIVGPVPEIGWDVPRRLAVLERLKQPWARGPSLDEFLRRQRKVLPILKTLERNGVPVMYPHEVLCRTTCLVERNGQILYRDSEHLTTRGAELLEPGLGGLLARGGVIP